MNRMHDYAITLANYVLIVVDLTVLRLYACAINIFIKSSMVTKRSLHLVFSLIFFWEWILTSSCIMSLGQEMCLFHVCS